MAHRTSASALNAARSVLSVYNLTVRTPEDLPSGRVANLKADEACLAVIIDYATNIFQLSSLRPELRYWQERMGVDTASAPQIALFLKKVLEAYGTIPQYKPEENQLTTVVESPVEFRAKPSVQTISKASLEASRFVFYYYSVEPKRGSADKHIDRVRVARLVEGSLNMHRIVLALPLVRDCQDDLRRGSVTPKDVKKVLRTLGILLEYLPNYEEREEELKLL